MSAFPWTRDASAPGRSLPGGEGKRSRLGLALFAVGLVLAGGAIAQSAGGTYAVSSHAIAAGGGRATGGNYGVDVTLGQIDAKSTSGGAYSVSGGFQQGEAPGGALLSDGFE